jgi:hypothetical protein
MGEEHSTDDDADSHQYPAQPQHRGHGPCYARRTSSPGARDDKGAQHRPDGQTGPVADVAAPLRRRLEAVPGVAVGESMFGHGTAYWVNGREIAHFEGDGDIEVRLTRPVIAERRRALKADDRVRLRPSGGDWITVRFDSTADVDFVVELVTVAEQAHRPAPGVMAKPPPIGADLERRRRFH